MLLAIDTSTRSAAVALAGGDRVVALRAWHSMVNHSAELMPSVAQILHSRAIRPMELSGVAVALGPGGFSALRTGISAAKGLSMAANIPIIGVGSLDLEVFPFRDANLPVCALLEAGRGEAASAILSSGGNRQREDRITGSEELLDEIEAGAYGPMVLCGEGLLPWADAIKSRLGDRAVLCHTPPSARVAALALMAQERLQHGDTDDLGALQPNYLRMPTIGEPKRRDRRRQASGRRAAGLQRGA